MKEKLKISDAQPDTASGEQPATEEDPLVAQEMMEERRRGAAEPSPSADCYDQSKSFFDSISCEAEGNRCVCVCVCVCVRVCVVIVCGVL